MIVLQLLNKCISLHQFRNAPGRILKIEVFLYCIEYVSNRFSAVNPAPGSVYSGKKIIGVFRMLAGNEFNIFGLFSARSGTAEPLRAVLTSAKGGDLCIG